jgi:glycosyltransferase involved in cell wall biosynthesis
VTLKVYYDVTSLLSKNLTTDGIYTKHLFRLLRGLGVDVDPVYKVPRGVRDNFIEYHLGNSPRKFRSLFASRGSILHGPSGNFLSESDKFKRILSVNDLGMFRDGFMPPNVAESMQTHLKQQIQGSVGAVLVPSYEVHNEFLVRFPKMVGKVHVVTPGSDHLQDASSVSAESLMKNPYFLFVGTIGKKTNLTGVLKAFQMFCNVKKGVDLAIVGDNGYGSEAVHKLLKGADCRDRVSLLGYRTGSQLKKLYGGALATVIPSYYEGFSFPQVEAMRMGCPVITSATGTLKEIGGEGVHLVNPKDPEQILGGMERMVADKVYRDKKVAAATELVQPLTWLNTAKAVSQIYQKL